MPWWTINQIEPHGALPIQHHCNCSVPLWHYLYLIHTTTFHNGDFWYNTGLIVLFIFFSNRYISWKPFTLLLALPSLGYFKDKEALVKQKRLWCMKQYLKRPSVATCIKALGIYTIKLVSQYLITQLYRAAVCMHIVIT